MRYYDAVSITVFTNPKKTDKYCVKNKTRRPIIDVLSMIGRLAMALSISFNF